VAALFGGVCMGAGMGLVLSRGGSTGGMDIVNKIIAQKIPHLKLGQITFCTDILIVSISGIVFQSFPIMLYAIITIFVSMMALDKVLYGFNVCKLIYIVSTKTEEISKEIISQMNRGATIMESYGAYTNEKMPTIMCAVRQNEYFKLKQIIKSIDANAFIMITRATEIVGSGFKSNDV
ncbi:MAG: YitT family protein, partial [Oscillospiraceae bacterium]